MKKVNDLIIILGNDKLLEKFLYLFVTLLNLIMNYFPIKISGSDTGSPLNLEKRISLIKRNVNLKDKYILDCGCGAGSYLFKLKKYTQFVFGIEYSGNKLKLTKNYRKSINFLQGNIEILPYKDESFDIIILNEVIEHIPEQLRALREIFRVLKVEGTIILFAPNRLYPFETHSVTFKQLDKTLPIHFPFIPYIPLFLGERIFQYHARNYFPSDLKSLINIHGFEIFLTGYITQTVEGIGGHNNLIYRIIRPIFRTLFIYFEKIPIIRNILSASQYVFAVKKHLTQPVQSSI